MNYLLALDQGTSSSRSIVFNPEGQIVSLAQREITQIYPQPGWVEHDPMQIWQTQLDTAREVWLAADHSKFNRPAMVEVGSISQIDHLFTDAPPPEPFAALLAEAQVQLHIAD